MPSVKKAPSVEEVQAAKEQARKEGTSNLFEDVVGPETPLPGKKEKKRARLADGEMRISKPKADFVRPRSSLFLSELF